MHAPGLNSGQLKKLLNGANQLKFMGECQLFMVPHFLAEKMCKSGLISLKMDGAVLRMKISLERL